MREPQPAVGGCVRFGDETYNVVAREYTYSDREMPEAVLEYDVTAYTVQMVKSTIDTGRLTAAQAHSTTTCRLSGPGKSSHGKNSFAACGRTEKPAGRT